MEDAANVRVRFRCVICEREQDMCPTPEAIQAVLDSARRGTMMCDACFALARARIDQMVLDLIDESPTLRLLGIRRIK
jgi:hypothetical protein